MRFLHLGDLHIGKKFNDVSLIEDQKYVLDLAVKTIKDEECDGLIIAGDVYDKSIMSEEALEVFESFINEVVKINVPIFIVSGNHDSNIRLSYFSSLLAKNNIYISDGFDGKVQTFELKDEYGDLYIHMLPFIKPSYVKNIYQDEEIKDYQDAISLVLKKSDIDYSKRNILVAHQFITGAKQSDSEDYSVGGLDHISSKVLENFDYVALGHLHVPQYVDKEYIRYSGSPLKYSFSECKEDKVFTIFEIKEKGNLKIDCKTIKPLRDVREIEGYLSDLLNQPKSDDYLKITINDEDVFVNSKYQLLMNYPNMLKFAVVNSKTTSEININTLSDYEKKSIEELFIDFYSQQNNNQEPSKDELKLFREIVETVKEDIQ